uniref:Putative secreted protein n=1 Tax=Panstrongylus lignarius TaxID=156445 RepID=A0A224Y407_9HEMI
MVVVIICNVIIVNMISVGCASVTGNLMVQNTMNVHAIRKIQILLMNQFMHKHERPLKNIYITMNVGRIIQKVLN